jgi:paraquat-inducible protein A
MRDGLHHRDGAQVTPPEQLADCPGCGLLQLLPPPVVGRNRRCRRCRTAFGTGVLQHQRALAFTLAALVLIVMVNLQPLLGVEVAGRGERVRLASMVPALVDHHMLPVALFVLAIAVIAPVGRMLAIARVLWSIGRGRRSEAERATAVTWMRLAERLRPWAMLDVFLIGTLVALTKLHDLATVEVGTGLWSLGVLVLCIAASERSIDRRALWNAVMPPAPIDGPGPLLGCLECGLVQPVATRCTRCRSTLHRRKPDSRNRATALVIAGLVLYLPANLFPILAVVSFGQESVSTILGGVSELLTGSDWPLAIIVFTASIAVPLLKLAGLAWLLISIRIGRTRRLTDRTRLFRLIAFVGRWSSVDVFVGALLTALVALGSLATVEPRVGLVAFAGVVVLTILATECFDTRLIWDAAGANDGRRR